MNKKALCIVFMLLVIPILSAIPVFAGKGQIKQEFVFHINGASIPGDYDKGVVSGPTDAPISVHIHGQEYAGEFSIEIGPSGTVETIPNECISYDCEVHYNFWYATYKVSGVVVRETISIYESGSKTTLRGTLVLLATGQGQESFTGYGTDEFEGLKIKGNTVQTIPNTLMDRIGTVMGGWPTP